ncbi:hypothetical protein PLANTIT3_20189 [Plantibacter sp. T3]|nr:hypothetical protein PLANTIT3_20189 [Plantibacter sp. T3]
MSFAGGFRVPDSGGARRAGLVSGRLAGALLSRGQGRN